MFLSFISLEKIVLKVILVTFHFKDQFSRLTNCLLACLLLAYWVFISTYKAHINALFCMIMFHIP